MKILAVDDDPDFLAVFVLALQDVGYNDVTFVESGQEALWQIAQEKTPFDCFILDIQMPEIDGIELCRRIRALPQYSSSPIVMNTNMSDRDHIDRAFLAGATDYLTKPIDKVEIRARLGVIEQLVAARRAAVSTEPVASQMRSDMPVFGFMDTIPLKRVSSAIDPVSMSNYIKTLGFFKVRSIGIVAIQVSNARQIYEMEGGAVYGEIMIDVACCLADSIKSSTRMISYLGGGTFVCVLGREEAQKSNLILDQLNAFITEFQPAYDAMELTLPNVEVGEPILCRPAHVRNPSRAVHEAIAMFRSDSQSVERIA